MNDAYIIKSNRMLKSLFNRIKSEKSQALSRQQKSDTPQKSQEKIMKPIGIYQFKPFDQSRIVQCGYEKIRYSVEAQAPDIFNRVLACPISVFNILPYGKRKVKQIDLQVHPYPSYLQHLRELLSLQLPTFNHLLINVYPPGIGIMPHFDGPMYKSKVVVLSLGGPAIINFTPNYNSETKVASLLLQDQSIHIFQAEMYEKVLHGIPDYPIDSIFFKIKVEDNPVKILLKRASVSNFEKTRLWNIVVHYLQNSMLKKEEVQQVDLGRYCGYSCLLLGIKGNQQYNYKLEASRRQRISITIREQYRNQ